MSIVQPVGALLFLKKAIVSESINSFTVSQLVPSDTIVFTCGTVTVALPSMVSDSYPSIVNAYEFDSLLIVYLLPAILAAVGSVIVIALEDVSARIILEVVSAVYVAEDILATA